MCTAITIQTPGNDTYLGRTMDFSYPLESELFFIPKGYEWNNMLNTHRTANRYSYMGIGQNLPPAVSADGVNEMGFAAAALYFPGYAEYDAIDTQDLKTPSIAAVELVGFLLGLSASVEQACGILRSIRIVGVKDSVTNSIAPLHWIMADNGGKCVTVEKTGNGLRIMDNSMGVLSNSPDFQWHMTNLRNYMNVTPSQTPEKEWNSVKLSPFGQGAGTFGLPGDYTPPSRFVRAAYQKSHVSVPSDRENAVVACFHIMDTLSIPKGIVVTDRQTDDYTQYTAFMNLSTKEYFFRTYDNSEISAVRFPQNFTSGQGIISLGKLSRPIHLAYRQPRAGLQDNPESQPPA